MYRMIPLEKAFRSYWLELTGRDLTLQDASDESLPLFLRHRYLIRTTSLFGTRYHLAIENDPADPCSPGEYADHLRVLTETIHAPVALILAGIPSYARNRMVRLGIPFIVPGSQIFLPPLLVDLRERQPVAIKRSRGKMLTPAAQCLVLFHLQRESLSKKPLQEIAKLIGYSPIMVTMVKRELESAGICEALKQGRSVTLSFLHDRRELWDRVEPLLSSPCRRNWVKWVKPDPVALLAGMSALSHLTMISDDPLPTYALGRKIFRAHNEQGDFHVCHERDEANACLESWSYDPRILSRGAIVDTLSLYLSLRGSADERVQQQLENLIREFPW
jgi:DNA-binding MarR family transcriptional regulator